MVETHNNTCSQQYGYLLDTRVDDYQGDCFLSSRVTNPLLTYPGDCILVNSTKHKYYIHGYYPLKCINYMKRVNKDDPYLQQYLDDMNATFDCQDDNITKRCNCVSIVLYWNHPSIETTQLLSYLTSIYQTIQNVHHALPNWIVRVYLDISVHDSLVYSSININRDQQEEQQSQQQTQQYKQVELDKQHMLDECFVVYNDILDADNCEVYTYIFNSSTDSSDNNIGNDVGNNANGDKGGHSERKRILRFLPFIDNTVNTVIVREADGIVSYKDCCAIDQFSTSPYIFHVDLHNINALHHFNKHMDLYHSYASWLIFYKILDEQYFSHKQNVVDLLAGTIGLNLKVKRQVFEDNILQINDMIDNYNPDVLYQQITQYYNMDPGFVIDGKVSRKQLNRLLTVGFDEILLLHMFRQLLSVDISVDHKGHIHYNRDMYDLIYSSLMIEFPLTILTFISNDDVNSNDNYYQQIASIINTMRDMSVLYMIDSSDNSNETTEVNTFVNLLVHLCHKYNETEYIMVIFDCLFHPLYYNHSWLYASRKYIEINIDKFYIVNLLNIPLSRNSDITLFDEQVSIKSHLYRTLPTLYSQYLEPV